MIKLPDKKSIKWLYIASFLFILTFVSLVFLSMVLNANISVENIIGFAFLSIIISIIISIGGYLGAKAFFTTALIFYILGILYMMYVSINRTAEGWSDLVSIFSFMFTVGIGIVLGLVIQGVWFFVLKKRQ